MLPTLLTLLALLIAPGAPSWAQNDRPVISSASEIDYPPFCFVDDQGRPDGFSVELLRAAVAAMNRDLTFLTGTWPEVRAMLERGEVDALPLVGRTPEREPLFDFTVPYMSLHGAIVVRQDNTDIRNLDDLAGRQVAVMQGDNAEEFLRREDRGAILQTTPTFEIALQELSEGRHDAVVVQRLVALRLVNELGLTNLRVLDRPIEDFRQDFCFAVTKGDASTLALLNEGLAIVIADGTYRHLHAKWFAALQLPTERPLVVGGDHLYPPFEFLDERGRPAGHNVDLTRAIAREMGFDVEIRLGPWAEMVDQLESGAIDVLPGMFYTPQRDLKFAFSQPHTVSHYVGVSRAGEGPPPATLDDLAGRRIVLQHGDVIVDTIRDHVQDDQLTFVDSQGAILRELAEGRHDCAIVLRIGALELIEQYGWTNLELGRRPFVSLDYCFATRNDQRALLAQFSEGLKVLEESGEFRRIHDKWLGVHHDMGPPTFLVALRYSAIVLIPLLLILLLAALWTWALRRQVREKTRQLRESLDQFQYIFESANVGKSLTLPNGEIHPNQAYADFVGYTREELEGKTWQDLTPPEDIPMSEQKIAPLLQGEQDATRFEKRYLRKDGALVWADVSTRIRRDEQGRPLHFITTIVDISQRKQAEQERERLQGQLIQAQKMESVGRLAGGVAHDFNNILQVMLGYSEMLLDTLPPQGDNHDFASEIAHGVDRASALTRQLLAFARKQTIQPVALDFNAAVEGMLKMLRRLIGEDIDLAWLPESRLWTVKMDAGQIDQILANLCVNARDAIGGVGEVTIETDNVTLDADYCAERVGFVPGDYVLLTISDDGSGMDRETLEHIFEPFFSTKGVHEGTGLGLATVYGIVKQNNGFINVYSEPGQGTTFKIYLPRFEGEALTEAEARPPHLPTGAGECVLLVEDDATILSLGARMLERLGYDVFAAPTPGEALHFARERDGAIDLLITDVVMPEMNGRQLANQLAPLCPGIKVLYMSGYTADVIAHRGVLEKGVRFLQKPFSIESLATKTREALGG